MYHEVQHAKQAKAILEQENNFLIYDMNEDVRMIKYFGKSYYKDNYSHVKLEIDARIAANIKLVEYLQNLGINDERILNMVQNKLREDNKLKAYNLRKAISNIEEYAQYIENDEFQEEILQAVSKIKEKDEFKQNEENEICSLNNIAKGANAGSLDKGKKVFNQIKGTLKKEGRNK